MKLQTKLTALCAALLLLVAVSLTAAMLWQVREQSYRAGRTAVLHMALSQQRPRRSGDTDGADAL